MGFFNESSGANYPDPRNYTWQLTTPVYAQAVSSYYEDILKEGRLLTDEEGNPVFRYWAGDPNVVVTIRKHLDREIYAIACSINPISNTENNVASKKDIIISFLGEEMTMEVRKQGSVYMLDRTNPEHPVFWQLDSWHETGHPINWKTEMAFEAEVYEEESSMNRVTYSQNEGLDFSSFKSYVKAEAAGSSVSYSVPGGKFPSGKARLSLTAGQVVESAGNIMVQKDGVELGRISLSPQTSLLHDNGFPNTENYTMEIEGIEKEGFTLTFICGANGIVLDNFVLTPI